MEKDKQWKLIQAGAEIFGGAVGGAIGLVGGPGGAIGGSVAGVVVSKGLIEFADRLMSKREFARVGGVISLVVIDINKRIEQGEALRQDGFFSADKIMRSNAEELFEGLLIKCRNEYEERKLAYVASIFVHAAFDSSISSAEANQALLLTEHLTYRQLVVLALVGQNNQNHFNLRSDDYGSVFEFSKEEYKFEMELQFLLQDFVTLYNNGLITRVDNSVIHDFGYITPGKMKLTEMGQLYFRMLNLKQMPKGEFVFLKLLKT